jgi:hypothetical protein
MIKNMIRIINTALANREMEISVAEELLLELETLTSKHYGIRARRVVMFQNDEVLDAYVNS